MSGGIKILIKNPQALAIALVFSVNSVVYGTWVTRIPYFKAKLDLSVGELGLALFFIPLGAILAMTAASFIIQKYGEGKTTFWSGFIFCLLVFVVLAAPSRWTFSASLFVLGLANGCMDVAMNSAAASIERIQKIKIMSTSHGFFSLGGMIGAGLGALALLIDLSPWWQFGSILVFLMLFLILFIYPRIKNLHSPAEEGTEHFALPGKPLVGLALVGFAIMIGEGAIADWSAVYLKDVAMAHPAYIGLGFAGFSLAMTIGRFSGDHISLRYKGSNIIRVGCGLAVLGYLLLFTQLTSLNIVGFTLIGLGYSCAVPILFSKSSEIPGIVPSQGIAAMATAGFGGFLLGPVIIGAIGEWLGLVYGFGLLMVLSALCLMFTGLAFKKIQS